jgi:spoIIIJ-associated protein
VPEEELTIEAQGQIAEQFLGGVLERFGTPGTTSVTTRDEDTIEIQVTGADLGLLIGPKGQTLQALQELTRTVVQRRSVARTGRILVDVGGYRQRRKEALERFTRQVAQDVLATGEQRGLEPMNAADRKVVHDTVNDLVGVKTRSEGEEPRRRVVILPGDAAETSSEATESPGEAVDASSDEPGLEVAAAADGD